MAWELDELMLLVSSDPEWGVAAVWGAESVPEDAFDLLCSWALDVSELIFRRDESDSSNALVWLVLAETADVLIDVCVWCLEAH